MRAGSRDWVEERERWFVVRWASRAGMVERGGRAMEVHVGEGEREEEGRLEKDVEGKWVFSVR